MLVNNTIANHELTFIMLAGVKSYLIIYYHKHVVPGIKMLKGSSELVRHQPLVTWPKTFLHVFFTSLTGAVNAVSVVNQPVC